MEFSILDNEFVLSQNELKVFYVLMKSECDISIYASIDGVDGECISCHGKDYLGNSFDKLVNVKSRIETKVWFYIKAPNEECEKNIKIVFYEKDGKILNQLDVNLKTTAKIVDEEQFNDIYSLRRLVWLNSDYAINDEVPKPFIPVNLKGKDIYVLGRKIQIDSFGLPKSICSYFTQGIKIGKNETNILSDSISFNVDNQLFYNNQLDIKSQKSNVCVFAKNESNDFCLQIDAKVEFDGFVSYKMILSAKKDVNVNNVYLKIPITDYCQKYFMGLGKNGGLFDGRLDWKWSKERQQDGFWIGNINSGLKLQFLGSNYSKPLVNIYYAHKPLLLPDSWDNDGKGGIKYENNNFIVYTGDKNFKCGEYIEYNFNMLITPLKEIDLKKQLQMRFYHKLDGKLNDWFNLAKENGANIINVHHGNDLNPYINYPFFETDELRKFVKLSHENDIKVKIYYTIRELTINTPEFSAFRSLGNEIFEKPNENVKGSFWQSEAKEWIRQNIGNDVIPAWRQILIGEKYKDEYDASVITNGCSRLCNFYVESLKNILENTDVDGLYIDDVAYDRNTMKRVRKVLDERKGRLIDFHTWNHNFNDLAGNTSCLYLYAELLPYIDKLWIGEGFDYNSSFDYWLVEISGIPFGLMSEMLEADWQEANQWKGLVFGMTSRLGWTDVSGMANPTNVWKIFDNYRLDECELIGFWDERNDVECDSPFIKATQYKRGDEKYIAIANFSNKDQITKVKIKNSPKYKLYCPFVERFQEEKILGEEIYIPNNQGLFIVVKNN